MHKRFKTSKFNYVLGLRDIYSDNLNGSVSVFVEGINGMDMHYVVRFSYKSNDEILRQLHLAKLKLKKWLKS